MNHPIYLIEFSLTGTQIAPQDQGKATILGEVEITARNAESAHTIFVERCKALELDAQVLEISENPNCLEEAKDLAIEISERLNDIQRDFDKLIAGKSFISEEDYQDLRTWYEENLESLEVNP